MPGAGGIRMMDHMNKVAPRDGTVIGTVAPGPIIEPLVGKRKIDYRMTDFTMLAAMDKDVTLCLAWGASQFKTIQDVMKETMTVAGTGAGSSTDIYPMFLNEVMGTKFQGHHRLSGLAGDHHRDRARRGGRPLRLGLVEPQQHQARLGARQEGHVSPADGARTQSEGRRAAGASTSPRTTRPGR